MSLTPDGLNRLRQLLTASLADNERLTLIRQEFKGLSLTCCDASDMDTETPAMETENFCLYLMDTHEHCVSLTLEPEKASGLILAKKTR